MAADDSWDLVCVGGGMAGLIGGYRAAELGLRACVLERGSDERYLCNSRFTGGTFHVCLRDIMSDESELNAAILADTEGAAPAALAGTIARDGRRLVRWLQSLGARFMKASPAAYHNWVLAPPRPAQPGLDWEGRGGDVLLRSLARKLEERGGRIVRGARATALLMENGRSTGVEVEVGGAKRTLSTRAVLLADGGFQGNPELVRQYVSPAPERVRQRGAGTGIGDGLVMARIAGARIIESPNFYGHVLARDAMANEKLWPYPTFDSLCAAGILVDTSGRRIGDEGRSGVYTANVIARHADPLSTFAIFDAAIWNETGKRDLIPPNPHLERCGGTLLGAPTLAALAEMAGIAPEGLQITVQEYNAAVAAGTCGSLAPARTPDRYRPFPIAKPPFHAVPLCAGITYTMGGIAVDEHGCVEREGGGTVSGLYAAGSTVGGVDGGPHAGYVGGLVKAGVLGLRAAEHLAAALKDTPKREARQP